MSNLFSPNTAPVVVVAATDTSGFLAFYDDFFGKKGLAAVATPVDISNSVSHSPSRTILCI